MLESLPKCKGRPEAAPRPAVVATGEVGWL